MGPMPHSEAESIRFPEMEPLSYLPPFFGTSLRLSWILYRLMSTPCAGSSSSDRTWGSTCGCHCGNGLRVRKGV
jgi:hypothetical protein